MLVSNARILVVDDNPATLYATSRVLRGAGWEVLEAKMGGEALALVQQGVDLIVLDVNMPDIDGLEVCRRLRADESTARLPIIHLSATFVRGHDKVQGYESGGDGYLTHPVEPPVLIATVNAFLRTRRAEREREELLLSERAARAEAERANRIKDDFLATLSHELRTPLNAIVGWAQLLKLGRLEPAEVEEALETIERNAKMQAQMIADLLDVSSITSGKIRLDVEQVSPAALIEATISSIMPAAKAKEIAIERHIDGSAGPVAGDPARLQQVVWNLLTNAVKFTPPSGTIRVFLRQVGSHVEIQVADTGQGLSPELLPRIFERFHQGNGGSTREYGGLGLGLAIAKQLTEMHGGSIRAESPVEGQGASFIVSLPVAASPSQTLSSSTSPAVVPEDYPAGDLVSLKGVRVLIVEDDRDARTLLKRIIADSGAIALDVDRVNAALAAIDEFKPNILISDLAMPGRDGFDLIREVRSRGYTFRDLPAVALTAYAGPEDRRRVLLAGFQVHVAKPIDARDLTTVVATLVGCTGN